MLFLGLLWEIVKARFFVWQFVFMLVWLKANQSVCTPWEFDVHCDGKGFHWDCFWCFLEVFCDGKGGYMNSVRLHYWVCSPSGTLRYWWICCTRRRSRSNGWACTWEPRDGSTVSTCRYYWRIYCRSTGNVKKIDVRIGNPASSGYKTMYMARLDVKTAFDVARPSVV